MLTVYCTEHIFQSSVVAEHAALRGSRPSRVTGQLLASICTGDSSVLPKWLGSHRLLLLPCPKHAQRACLSPTPGHTPTRPHPTNTDLHVLKHHTHHARARRCLRIDSACATATVKHLTRSLKILIMMTTDPLVALVTRMLLKALVAVART